MSDVRLADYYVMEAPDRAGEGARVLGAIRDAGVNLLAFSGFPQGRRAQLDFVPENGEAFRAAARSAKLKVKGPKKVFLVRGEDRPGVVAQALERLAAAKINVTSVQAVCADAGRFGALLWVKPRDVKRAAAALQV